MNLIKLNLINQFKYNLIIFKYRLNKEEGAGIESPPNASVTKKKKKTKTKKSNGQLKKRKS